MKKPKIETIRLRVYGLIQGVGFRPFVYKLASELKLNGLVYNQNTGVVITLQGEKARILQFIDRLTKEAPQAAQIEKVEKETILSQSYFNFSIAESQKVDKSITRISPDIAVCADCLSDMQLQAHRLNYPFTNCTNCGPRFSIVESIPYDRNNTSMKTFEMCPVCKAEYHNPLNRRFHAQPVACNSCGPTYCLHEAGNAHHNFTNLILQLAKLIDQGGIVAMKGLGGYHLACDALNAKAIEKLRKVKVRDGKPFALMVSSIEIANHFAAISEEEKTALLSWQRPIVLLKSNVKAVTGIADGLKSLGIFLPYMPLHHQLFQHLNTQALVMTSGNITHCPIIIENLEALDAFSLKTDAVLTHNRPIVNRLDDSVVQLIGNRTQILRRARGYVPTPLKLLFETEGILATGAELSGAFCIGKGREAIMSPHLGDLRNLETLDFFETTLNRYKSLFEFQPKLVVCDLHPDYLSTRLAENTKLPVIRVQHHHAHIASAMAEFGLDEEVIGVVYDGTGYGTDNHSWGSEIMVASLSSFSRKYHFEYIPVPGGDKVAEEPWRSALAYLYAYFGESIPTTPRFIHTIGSQKINLCLQALEQKINTPLSCSAGRLFDAVSALLDVCKHATYHAEAPIMLENCTIEGITDSYPVKCEPEIVWKETFIAMLEDLNNQVPVSVISTKFHNTIIQVTFEAIKKIHQQTGITKVILSGGTFQNKYLSENLLALLHLTGYETYISAQIPVNDGGIALGQMAIAAKQLALCV
ncbi:MAG: carbamoyltransferase HypF [Bacteroidota bacterium]|nr:MAG: carbamoyltransferase HypF [Bacteroidota bacterium]